MPGFGKILGAVSEIMRYGRTDARTHARKDRTDFIGPSRFITGDQKNYEKLWWAIFFGGGGRFLEVGVGLFKYFFSGGGRFLEGV